MRISDWSSDVCSSDLETYEVGDQMSASLAPQYQTCARSPATCCAGLPRFQCRNRNRMRASKLQQTPEHAHVFHPCRSEEHTSELQSLMRISYAVFCLKKKKQNNNTIKYI